MAKVHVDIEILAEKAQMSVSRLNTTLKGLSERLDNSNAFAARTSVQLEHLQRSGASYAQVQEVLGKRIQATVERCQRLNQVLPENIAAFQRSAAVAQQTAAATQQSGASLQGFFSTLTSGNMSIRGVVSSLGSLNAAVAAPVAIGVAGWAAVFDTLKNSITGAIAVGDSLDELKEKTGASVELLSSLKLAAETSDTSLESLAVGIRYMSQDMVKAGRGSESIQEELLKLADELHALPPGAERTTLAIERLGRSGQDLIPMLSQGREGLQGWIDKSTALGGVMSGETAAGAAAVADAFATLKAAGDGFMLQVGTGFIPLLQELSQLFSENKGLLEGIGAVSKGVGNALRFEFEGVAVLVRGIKKEIEGVQIALDTLKRVGKTIGVLKIPGPAMPTEPSAGMKGSLDAQRKAEADRIGINARSLADMFPKDASGTLFNGKAQEELDKASKDAAASLRELSRGVKAVPLPGIRPTLLRPGEKLGAVTPQFGTGPQLTSDAQLQRMIRGDSRGSGFADMQGAATQAMIDQGPGTGDLIIQEIEQGQALSEQRQRAAEEHHRIADALKAVQQEGFGALGALQGVIPPETLEQLDEAAARFESFQQRVSNSANMAADAITLMATGARQGGLALVAAFMKITGMAMVKWGLHMSKQGGAEVALGTAPPPFGPNPALVGHGAALIATGATYGAVGAGLSAAGTVAGAVAGVMGQGGEKGSPLNPVHTKQAGPLTFDADAVRVGQLPGTAQIPTLGGGGQEGSRFAAFLDRVDSVPAGVVMDTAASDRGGWVMVLRPEMPDLGRAIGSHNNF